jgi:hypothetical protein
VRFCHISRISGLHPIESRKVTATYACPFGRPGALLHSPTREKVTARTTPESKPTRTTALPLPAVHDSFSWAVYAPSSQEACHLIVRVRPTKLACPWEHDDLLVDTHLREPRSNQARPIDQNTPDSSIMQSLKSFALSKP